MNIKLTDFSMKHFERKSHGTKILNHTPEEFESRIKEAFKNAPRDFNAPGDRLPGLGTVHFLDGYAPFCKLVAITNFTDAKVGSLPITESNYQYLRSGYSSRRDSELSVLSRWLDLPLGKPRADWLLLVLYDKNQVNLEAEKEYSKAMKRWNNVLNQPMEKPEEPKDFEADWGIITILGQSHPNEEPMAPITQIRNAFMDGGSGAPIDEAYYKRAVEFWDANAVVK